MSASTLILATFDSIINTDLGLLKLIKKEFNSPKFMIPEVLHNDDMFFKLLLLSAKNPNPLYLVLKPEKYDQADTIYETFLREKYNMILDLSERNDVYRLMLTYLKTGDGLIKVFILCKNESEKQFINRLNPDINTIVSSIENVDLKNYDSIFVKNARDLLKFKNLTGKNIFVLNYLSNFNDDEKTFLSEIAVAVCDVNIIHTVDVYLDLTIPSKEIK